MVIKEKERLDGDRDVQNRPDDLKFTRPCNQSRFDPVLKNDLQLCKQYY